MGHGLSVVWRQRPMKMFTYFSIHLQYQNYQELGSHNVSLYNFFSHSINKRVCQSHGAALNPHLTKGGTKKSMIIFIPMGGGGRVSRQSHCDLVGVVTTLSLKIHVNYWWKFVWYLEHFQLLKKNYFGLSHTIITENQLFLLGFGHLGSMVWPCLMMSLWDQRPWWDHTLDVCT